LLRNVSDRQEHQLTTAILDAWRRLVLVGLPARSLQAFQPAKSVTHPPVSAADAGQTGYAGFEESPKNDVFKGGLPGWRFAP
jgi:hypothetical protein